MSSNKEDTSFNILGSSKLNTADYKNPSQAANNDSFNILGSSKLNTADGKNPTQAGQPNTEEYRKECRSAHDALENRLRDDEREVSNENLALL